MTAPIVKYEKKHNEGGHYYPGIVEDEFIHTSDCEHDCGCWMGGTRSGGPDGVDQFGECPNNPSILKTKDVTT